MFDFLKIFRKKKWDLNGGIHPPEMKIHSNEKPIRHLLLADRFIIPLKQHIGHNGEICIKPGDKVLRGQPLTIGSEFYLPVHAPTSGTIEAITQHVTAHPSGIPEISVFIIPDGKDLWIERNGVKEYRQLTREELIKRIHQAGIAGLGGAGFPTAIKLKRGLNRACTLIINAAECEPYVTADESLIQECADEIIEGIHILAWILQVQNVLIGIEDNKKKAISALERELNGIIDIQLCIIPTKYPSGGSEQLTKILTGKEIPCGGCSYDIGVLIQNISTVYTVKRAIINGEPITERVITLTGEALTEPGNVWGRLGTPVNHLLQQVGFQPQEQQIVIMGGPLMGFILPSLDVPVVKITNCLLAPSSSELGEKKQEFSCIRCGVCADVCPVNLLPQQLYWYIQDTTHNKTRAYHIESCIECGACSWICPSNIPLVNYFHREKEKLRALDLEKKRADIAKERFGLRQARLKREKFAARTRKFNKQVEIGLPPRKNSDLLKAEIESAIARAKEKKQNSSRYNT